MNATKNRTYRLLTRVFIYDVYSKRNWYVVSCPRKKTKKPQRSVSYKKKLYPKKVSKILISIIWKFDYSRQLHDANKKCVSGNERLYIALSKKKPNSKYDSLFWCDFIITKQIDVVRFKILKCNLDRHRSAKKKNDTRLIFNSKNYDGVHDSDTPTVERETRSRTGSLRCNMMHVVQNECLVNKPNVISLSLRQEKNYIKNKIKASVENRIRHSTYAVPANG